MSKVNILVFPNMEGNCSDEQIEEYKPLIFPCGKCSNNEFDVYHNLIGQHRHQTNYKLWRERN